MKHHEPLCSDMNELIEEGKWGERRMYVSSHLGLGRRIDDLFRAGLGAQYIADVNLREDNLKTSHHPLTGDLPNMDVRTCQGQGVGR